MGVFGSGPLENHKAVGFPSITHMDTLENHKYVGLPRNTRMDPLENHKSTPPAFSVGPSSARQ